MFSTAKQLIRKPAAIDLDQRRVANVLYDFLSR